MAELEIIHAGLEHAGRIGRIGAASWQAAYRGIIPDAYLSRITMESRTLRTIELMGRGETEYLLFRAEDADLGMAALHRALDVPHDPHAGEVGAFYFLPEYWGAGWAAPAMEACLDALRAAGYSRAVLWVLEDNPRARRFYAKCGFAPDGGRKTIMLGKPLVEIRLTLTI